MEDAIHQEWEGCPPEDTRKLQLVKIYQDTLKQFKIEFDKCIRDGEDAKIDLNLEEQKKKEKDIEKFEESLFLCELVKGTPNQLQVKINN